MLPLSFLFQILGDWYSETNALTHGNENVYTQDVHRLKVLIFSCLFVVITAQQTEL